jgi:N,N-dimethylformamidase beta subunit-like, C-terminal
MVWAYGMATSCEQGSRLSFRLGGGPARGVVRVEDAVDGTLVHEGTFSGTPWHLPVGATWRSSLYRAEFQPGAGPENEAFFAVRRAGPGRAPVLLSVPFATWQAYRKAGIPGQSIYWTEDPLRAASVSLDRPGGGPPPEQWEHGMMRWLRACGAEVDYCSNLDLHFDPALLDDYRLLLIVGHDEYWTWEMRDAVEAFTRRGGNVAIFGANTCWWQMRLADQGRTMICYRDAIADPAAADGRPERSTVEWSSAPVCRPENAMTGLSFRLGAGCWELMSAMLDEAYTVRFADHWVFEGTGLTDGARFGRGCLGYETDAADIDESGGAPRVTGRDGTPGSFTVLATADLRHWAAYGQGGAATMGVFTAGCGTVFNAGTVNWGAALGDPVVARITSNVLDRLAGPRSALPEWTAAGTRDQVLALASSGSALYAVLADHDQGQFLGTREACWQAMPWRAAGDAAGIVALASPRDALAGAPGGLYALHRDGIVLTRPASPEAAPWTRVGTCPPRPRCLAVANNHFFVLDQDGTVWSLPQAEIGAGVPRWTSVENAANLITLTALNGRLIAADASGSLVGRVPAPGAGWEKLGDSGGCMVLTGHAGSLYGASPGRPLLRRPLP